MYSKFTKNDAKVTIQLGEVVSFFNKGNLHKKFDEIDENSEVVIDGSINKHLDYDIIDLIDDFRHSAKSRNINVIVIGFDIHNDLNDTSPLKNN
jgi:carbonic anhydrase